MSKYVKTKQHFFFCALAVILDDHCVSIEEGATYCKYCPHFNYRDRSDECLNKNLRADVQKQWEKDGMQRV